MPVHSNHLTQALVRGFFQDYPDEAAPVLERLPIREMAALLERQPRSHAAVLLDRMTPEIARQVLQMGSDSFTAEVLSALEPARAALLLMGLDETHRSRSLALLNPTVAGELRVIMTYPGDTAGSLMNPRVLTFRPESTVKEVLSRIRLLRRRRVYDLFVVDSQGFLIGSVPFQEAAVTALTERIGSLIKGPPVYVQAMLPKDQVVDLMGHQKITTLPVTDIEGRLLGAIHHEALVTAAQEEVSADMQTMVGASKEERALSKVSFAVRKRLPWLHINLGTAFLAAAVVGLFEDMIARFTALAVLLPVVAGQSGNTGAQALAVTMRGLALHEITTYQWFRIFLKELRVGLINGIAVALTTAVFVFAWSRSPGLALVIGISMVVSMIAASISGVLIPVLLTAVGQDPAQSSSIILTTITDVVGFFSFLGIATMMAGML